MADYSFTKTFSRMTQEERDAAGFPPLNRSGYQNYTSYSEYLRRLDPKALEEERILAKAAKDKQYWGSYEPRRDIPAGNDAGPASTSVPISADYLITAFRRNAVQYAASVSYMQAFGLNQATVLYILDRLPLEDLRKLFELEFNQLEVGIANELFYVISERCKKRDCLKVPFVYGIRAANSSFEKNGFQVIHYPSVQTNVVREDDLPDYVVSRDRFGNVEASGYGIVKPAIGQPFPNRMDLWKGTAAEYRMLTGYDAPEGTCVLRKKLFSHPNQSPLPYGELGRETLPTLAIGEEARKKSRSSFPAYKASGAAAAPRQSAKRAAAPAPSAPRAAAPAAPAPSFSDAPRAAVPGSAKISSKGTLVYLGGDRATAEHILAMGYSRVECYEWNNGMGQYNRRMEGLSDKNYCMRIFAKNDGSVTRFLHTPGVSEPTGVERTDLAGISRILGFDVKPGLYFMWK